MGDLRGMGDMQGSSSSATSCLGQEMSHHPSMPQHHHQDMQQRRQQQGGIPTSQQDMQELEQDIGRELVGPDMLQHHQQQSQQLHQSDGSGMGVHEYYASQVCNFGKKFCSS